MGAIHDCGHIISAQFMAILEQRGDFQDRPPAIFDDPKGFFLSEIQQCVHLYALLLGDHHVISVGEVAYSDDREPFDKLEVVGASVVFAVFAVDLPFRGGAREPLDQIRHRGAFALARNVVIREGSIRKTPPDAPVGQCLRPDMYLIQPQTADYGRHGMTGLVDGDVADYVRVVVLGQFHIVSPNEDPAPDGVRSLCLKFMIPRKIASPRAADRCRRT
jgi:hypothetical protein